MSDPEPCRINHKDTEKQGGWCLFLIIFNVAESLSRLLMSDTLPFLIWYEIYLSSVRNIFYWTVLLLMQVENIFMK